MKRGFGNPQSKGENDKVVSTAPCPACGKQLRKPTEYLNAFEAIRKSTASFIPVIEKDFALESLKPMGGLSKADYRKWFVESINWAQLSEHDIIMLKLIDDVLDKLYETASS